MGPTFRPRFFRGLERGRDRGDVYDPSGNARVLSIDEKTKIQVLDPLEAIVGLLLRDMRIWQPAAHRFSSLALATCMVHTLERHKSAFGRDHREQIAPALLF